MRYVSGIEERMPKYFTYQGSLIYYPFKLLPRLNPFKDINIRRLNHQTIERPDLATIQPDL